MSHPNSPEPAGVASAVFRKPIHVSETISPRIACTHSMQTRSYLRLEGVAAFAAATAGFVLLDGPLWLYLVLALAPDIAMVGYLAGPARGSTVYNLVHTYVAPIGLIAVAWWLVVPMGVLGGLVWAAHIGADRALGYGLKHPTRFQDTHLGTRTPAQVTEPGLEPEPAD